MTPTPALRKACVAILSCVTVLMFFSASAQDERAADHEALIELRTRFTEALNGRDFEKMKPLVSDSLTFISISNEKVEGLDGLQAYWEKLFKGDKSVLKSVTVSPVADDRTTFFGDSIGLAQGTSKDVFEFRTVGTRELTTRWTAVVTKEGGQWKVAAVHMSANVLDNPVLDAAKGAGGLLRLTIGLVIGAVLGAVIFRRRASSGS